VAASSPVSDNNGYYNES